MATVGGTSPAPPKKPMSEKGKIAVMVAIISLAGTAITVAGSVIIAKITTKAALAKADTNIATLGNKADSIQNSIDYLSLPPGTIVAYGGDINSASRQKLDAAGWLLCDGALVPDGEKYQALAKMLGRIWGSGNNSDRVSLPNLQGMFLRGVDTTGTNDPDYQIRINSQKQTGPNVGSFQSDAFQTHAHHFTFKANNAQGAGNAPGGGGNKAIWTLGTDVSKGSSDDMVLSPVTLEGADGVRASKETRPKNAYVYYLIKY